MNGTLCTIKPLMKCTSRLIRSSFGAMIGHFAQALQRVSGVELGPVLAGICHVGQHIVLAIVHKRVKFGQATAQLIGDMPPGLVCSAGVGLQKVLADCGGDHGVLALGYMHAVAHPMRATALPASTEDAADRVAQPRGRRK
jgi:hypothetical protein